jgi:hypothetical protein
MKRKATAKKTELSLPIIEKEDFGAKNARIDQMNWCLDYLARLLQGSSSDFIATCLIDYTIVIADDKIHAGSLLKDAKGTKIKLIKTVMEYFSDLANERQEYKNSREEVFKQICLINLYDNEKGCMQLDNKIIDTISKEVLSFYEAMDYYKVKNPQYLPICFAQRILDYDLHLQHSVSVMYKTFTFAVIDFLTVEEFIVINRDNVQNDLAMAFKGKENQKILMDQTGSILPHQELAQSVNVPGYVILYADRLGVHAKTKIIEYLVYTGIIKNIETEDKIYIGTAQGCCKICNDLAKAVNKVFCSGEEIIQTIETYGLHFNWIEPMICEYNPNDFQINRHFHYSINSEQVNELNKLVPELKQTSEASEAFYQELAPQSFEDTQDPGTSTKKVEINALTSEAVPAENLFEPLEIWEFSTKTRRKLNPITIIKSEFQEVETIAATSEEAGPICNQWHDYLAIKYGVSKSVQPDNISLPVLHRKESEVTLNNQINQPNHAYIIPLSNNLAGVDSIYHTDDNFW